MIVNVIVRLSVCIPGAHPISFDNAPVFEVSFVDPFETHVSRIIVPILTALHPVHIEQNLDAVPLTGVQKPINFLIGTIGATLVWTVWSQGPIT